jgi:hypothetical protein
MAFDAARGVTVALDTTGAWTYDGNDWTRRSTMTFQFGELA